MSHLYEPYLLVFVLSIYDIFGFTSEKYRTHDSNPGVVKVSYGGVCRNIAENMARVGLNTKFISYLGNDGKARAMMDHAKKMNFDMSESLIVDGASTPTYMAILDEHGEMVSAVVDIDMDDYVTTGFVESRAKTIEGAEYVFFGADQPQIIEYIVKTFQGKTKFVMDPVSGPKAQQIKHLLPYFHTFKPNRQEAEAICGFALDSEEAVKKAGHYFFGLGIEHVFIRLAEGGIYYKTATEEGLIKTKKANVVNVTGAGDSFNLGLGYGYIHGLSVVDTVKFAQTMAILTISHEETICPDLDLETVKKACEAMIWEEIVF
ncbi:MAG: carbohydrate kinase family protein [Turicibacter sp.]|nr:carbohydrate kinase family protein [Turicibacter sp.]